MPSGLNEEEKARQEELESGGETGVTNSELDTLNRKETATMTDVELWDAADRHPGGKAYHALRERHS